MAKRDDEHAMEHFAAARDMLRYESDRLSNIFSAFLLANTVLMGFLLHATKSGGGFPGEPGTAVAGGLVGLCVSGVLRLLIALFIVAYATVTVWGSVDAIK